MSEELLIRQAAPTLAGLKTGNLFSNWRWQRHSERMVLL